MEKPRNCADLLNDADEYMSRWNPEVHMFARKMNRVFAIRSTLTGNMVKGEIDEYVGRVANAADNDMFILTESQLNEIWVKK